MNGKKNLKNPMTAFDWMKDVYEYWLDSSQRWILFMDILRNRGNNYFETIRKGEPPVLVFDYEVILEGRTFERPVNYDPARIKPRKTDKIDPEKTAHHRHRPQSGTARASAAPTGFRNRRRSDPREPRRFYPLSSRARAGTDTGRCGKSRDPLCRKSCPASSKGRKAGADRQLPGRLGGGAAGCRPARLHRPSGTKRLSPFVLVRGSGKEPDAICGRTAWRDLACLALIRLGPRQILMVHGSRRTLKALIPGIPCGQSSIISIPMWIPMKTDTSPSKNGGTGIPK